MDFVYAFTSDQDADFISAIAPSWYQVSSLAACYYTSTGKDTGAGWLADPKPTQLLGAGNALMAFAAIINAVVVAVEEHASADETVSVIGGVLVDTAPFVTLVYDLFPEALADVLGYVDGYLLLVPASGLVLQLAEADLSAQGQLPPGTTNPKRKGPPPGRPRRPTTPRPGR